MWKQVLAQFDKLEEIFEVLSVPYDPNVLNAHRLRILRRFGNEMQQLLEEPGRNDDVLKSRCAEALTVIHEQCCRGMRDPIVVLRGPKQQLVQLRRKPS